MRRRERLREEQHSKDRRMQAAAVADAAERSNSHMDAHAPERLPGITLVMPVKGRRAFSTDNWTFLMSTQYEGDIEFLFVLESEEDEAYAPLLDLQRTRSRLSPQQQPQPPQRQPGIAARLRGGAAAAAAPSVAAPSAHTHDMDGAYLGGTGKELRGPAVIVHAQQREAASGQPEDGEHNACGAMRIILAGLSATCSQKLHNLRAGALAASSKSEYVLFLDDDVALHPGSAAGLVRVLQQQPDLFMATGYPFDIPPRGASFLTYCMLVYHTPLLIAFSAAQRTAFVWGGCMLLRLRNLRDDKFGVLEAWTRGGYSDDLLLAALCTRLGLPIAAPSFAVFPQRLEQHVSWQQYWNYLRRQLYVLDTYATAHNRRLNHAMMVIHSWASWALAGGALSVMLRLLLMGCLAPWANWTPPRQALRQPLLQPPTLSATWVLADTSLVVYVASLALAHAALVWMTAEVLHLMATLSPPEDGTSAAARPSSHPGCPRGGRHTGRGVRDGSGALCQYHWAMFWAALLFESLLLPPCMAYTYCSGAVMWAGVTYHKQGGRVVRIDR